MSAADLLAWYDRERRALPWRDRSDPYAIWVSEIMLQQTQVDRVRERYVDFLRRFPTIADLAGAELEAVLAAWSGLGYYRRARSLHAAAREVVERHGGALPPTMAALLELPGIGAYTAAAVASIAFGESVAVLDGNVERVMARWIGLEDDPKRAAPRRRLREAATSLLDPTRPGDSNQALMELGATVCRPTRVSCGSCPLGTECVARAGRPLDFPRTKAAGRREEQIWVMASVRRDDRWIVVQEPTTAPLFAGLWLLPWAPVEAGRSPAESLERRWGGGWTIHDLVATVDHSVTYRRLTVSCIEAEWSPPPELEARIRWVEGEEIGELATPSLVDKMLAAIAQSDSE